MLSCCDFALVFKAMSDETRLKIIDMLSYDELCACDILEEFEITQPTLSYHMRILTESGLVKARKEGAWTRYALNPDSLQSLTAFLEKVSANRTSPDQYKKAGCSQPASARCSKESQTCK